MATATFIVRVESNYGDWFEYEYDYDFDGPASDFDPNDDAVREFIYQDVSNSIYYDLDFVRIAG